MKKKQKNNRKQHFVAVAIIFNDKGEVLLTKRHSPRSKFSHGKWQFPGGGIEFGEHPQHAVHREIREEIGIEIELLTPNPIVHAHMFAEANTHILVIGYPAKYISGLIDISHDKATSAAKWYLYQEIDFSSCLPQVQEMLKSAQDLLKTNGQLWKKNS